MTDYNIDSDGDLSRAPDNSSTRVNRIPPGVYTYKPGMKEDYLVPDGKLRPVPPKIYGDAQKMADRIVTTFLDRNTLNLKTGVLLAGLKGSGKTLISALAINKLITEHGAACIRIKQPIPGEALERMIGTSDQPIILDFDEYEKVYRIDGDGDVGDVAKRMQESLLGLLSGGMVKNLLSLFQVNKSSRINEFFINRPNRIFYTLEFGGLPRAVIAQFAEDRLPETVRSDFVRRITRIPEVSFDILTSITEEILRYNCSVEEAMRLMGFGDYAAIRFYRRIFHKNHDVSRLYDYADELRADQFYHLDIRKYDDEKEYFECLGEHFPVPYSVYQELPRAFVISTHQADMLELGETGVFLGKTSSEGVSVFYSPSEMPFLTVNSILENVLGEIKAPPATPIDRSPLKFCALAELIRPKDQAA